MKVTIKGELKPPCTAKDLTLAVLRVLGASGALGQAVEFYGPAVEALDLAGRITLASMMTEMGGIIGLIPPSEEVLAYCRAERHRGRRRLCSWSPSTPIPTPSTRRRSTWTSTAWSRWSPARPSRTTSSRCARWPAPGSTRCSSAPAPTAASRISPPWPRSSKGKQIAPGMVASVVPATREVYGQMLASGVLQTLFDAGFIISNPGCGGCASGHIGMVGEGQVQVSTSNRNFAGKQGPGDNYLASPAVVAAWAALTGETHRCRRCRRRT